MHERELLQRWQQGDQSAAQEIHKLYSQRLWRLAKARIDERLGQRVGASDIVQSAFRSFFRRAADGEFKLDHSESLWRLLAAITVNKARQHAEHHTAGRRDPTNEVVGEHLQPSLIARQPSPDEAVALADELESLIAKLREPEPEILSLCLQGFTPSEIAQQVDLSRWTVRRILDRIGTNLRQRLQPG